MCIHLHETLFNHIAGAVSVYLYSCLSINAENDSNAAEYGCGSVCVSFPLTLCVCVI